MNSNLKALIAACDNLGLSYSFCHPTKNLIEVRVSKKSFVFTNWATPLNSQSVMQLCQDKDYFYNYFKDVVAMPKSLAFFNHKCDAKYKSYLEYKSIKEMVKRAQSEFSYPMIVKKNRGSWGRNVFKVNNAKELQEALEKIFDLNSAEFDYVALVQEYIEIAREFRALYLWGELQFVYEKVIDGAEFKDNLSPLHWIGAKAKFIDDARELEVIKKLCEQMFTKLEIPFCGLDIAKSSKGEYYLIEANASPGFEHIIKHQGYEQVVELYEQILKRLGA